MNIGVIGLGNMGAAIAANLIKGGHAVTVYNRTRSKAESLVAMGAQLAPTPSDAAQGDAFISMLANDDAVQELVFDTTNGVMKRQGRKTIHISMSTISPALVARLTDEYSSAGLSFFSAPVLGRPDVAERGELVAMAAGEARLIEKCQPIFDTIARKVYVFGDQPQQANVAKVAANYMISAMLQMFGEAFALVSKAGIDSEKFYEMVAFDFFNSPIYQKYGRIVVDRNFEGGAFSVTMQAKDTKLASDCARELLCPMPFLSVLEDTFLSAIARGKGSLDPCAITQIIAENAGIGKDRE